MSEKSSKGDAERAILMVAADLLIRSISSNPDDYPKKFSKKHLRELEKHYKWQQDMSVKLSEALKILKKDKVMKKYFIYKNDNDQLCLTSFKERVVGEAVSEFEAEDSDIALKILMKMERDLESQRINSDPE